MPAVMELLGKANWWLPRPLARILPGPRLASADDGGADGNEPPARNGGHLPAGVS